ncbi:MAG: hypothetical protein ABIN67_10625, partial [Ferruginibacter sp.]
YLAHLLADIIAAHRTEIPLEDERAPSFEEHITEVENWLEGKEPVHSFGYYCGLDAINFPPPEQLNDDEIKEVLKAFTQMMFTWNLDIHLPEELPLAIAYTMTVDTLNSKTDVVNSGTMGFDFCTGYAPDCVFKEYCPCLKIWNEEDDKNDLQENKLPF